MEKRKQTRRKPQERETQQRPMQVGFVGKTEAEKWAELLARAAARGVKLPESK